MYPVSNVIKVEIQLFCEGTNANLLKYGTDMLEKEIINQRKSKESQSNSGGAVEIIHSGRAIC